MRKVVFPLIAFILVLISACSYQQERPCPLNMINPNSCVFGTYTTTANGCSVTSCRPTNDFDCNNLKIGDTYYDGCNTCSCTEKGGACTLMACENKDRIKAEGEMCGGIAGFQCEEGLKCRMEGNYPDAAGTCVKANCPMLSQPSPSFCPDGTIKPNYDETRTCIMGYSCEKASEKTNLDDSCNVHSDCEVKNVGNCCGYYPKCLNKETVTNPEAVKTECQKNGLSSVCGFPDINSCSCIKRKCVAN